MRPHPPFQDENENWTVWGFLSERTRTLLHVRAPMPPAPPQESGIIDALLIERTYAEVLSRHPRVYDGQYRTWARWWATVDAAAEVALEETLVREIAATKPP